MPALVKFNPFNLDLVKGVHDFSSDVFKVMLTNVAPALENGLKAELTEITAGSGYVAGGNAVATTATRTGGVAKVTAADTTFTATGGSIGPARYAVLYNDSAPGKNLIGYGDYGSSFTIADGEPFVVDFDNTLGVVVLN